MATIKGVGVDNLGDTGFKIERNGFVIYVDPTEAMQGSKKADVILLTAEDRYCPKNKILDILKEDTLLLAAPSVLDDDFCEMAAADFINQKGIEIKGIPGIDKNSELVVGYMITMNGVKMYHPGDTRSLPKVVDLKSEGVDAALLPDMSEKHAANLVREFIPKAVFPLNGSSRKLKGALKDLSGIEFL